MAESSSLFHDVPGDLTGLYSNILYYHFDYSTMKMFISELLNCRRLFHVLEQYFGRGWVSMVLQDGNFIFNLEFCNLEFLVREYSLRC